MVNFLSAALITTNVVSSWELYLLHRQWHAHRTIIIPSAMRTSITQENFEKTQSYARDKVVFAMVQKVKGIIEGTAGLAVMPKLWYGVEEAVKRLGWFGSSFARGGFVHSMAFSIAGDVIATVLDLPFSYYQTFVLEAKHGFNKTTKIEFVKDKIKSFLLRVGVLHPITVGLINFVVQRFGSSFPLYLFGGASLVITLATFLFPVIIQPLFNKFTPLPQDSSLRRRVEELARSLKFPLTKLFEVDGSRRSAHSNAYFYGFFHSKRVVLYDTLIKQLSEDQIVAVLSHEFGHWHHNHTTKMFVLGLAQLFAFCFGARESLFNPKMFADFGFARGDMSPFIGFQLFSVVWFEPLSTLLEYILSVISRRFEFQADAFAVSLGFGGPLRQALQVMQEENKASITPDWLFAALHYSHPPLVERLNALDDLEKKHQ